MLRDEFACGSDSLLLVLQATDPNDKTSTVWNAFVDEKKQRLFVQSPASFIKREPLLSLLDLGESLECQESLVGFQVHSGL
eukprot:EC813868.1.p3 GENE.EC813868.1~~EC813868.1.p3  ORF type:complete len:81 (+),score=30.71 EC813868.1:273-515(+)